MRPLFYIMENSLKVKFTVTKREAQYTILASLETPIYLSFDDESLFEVVQSVPTDSTTSKMENKFLTSINSSQNCQITSELSRYVSGRSMSFSAPILTKQ